MTTRYRNREPQLPQLPQFLTMAEVAALYRVDIQTIRRLITEGLPAYRVGNKTIRIRREDVENLLVPVDN